MIKNDLYAITAQENMYETTFKKNNEKLFLRMELVTKENEKCWRTFKAASYFVANGDTGVLGSILRQVAKDRTPSYEVIKQNTGFTEQEYAEFINKAVELNQKTNNKISVVISSNSIGTNHMCVSVSADSLEQNYIIYVTNNQDFSIQKAYDYMMNQELTLKNYIEAYKNILISVGSCFSKDHFHNRGISRNPYWVFEEKYAGLSMLLHGFSGVIAEKYFSTQRIMHVKPVGSMQHIIKKSLLPGEGYIKLKDEKKDITDIEVSMDDLEGAMNYIQISALIRIFEKEIKKGD